MLHHPSIVARVARRLISTEQSVDAIARETGFANLTTAAGCSGSDSG
jgi:transcriptional regulator GlxA family with amidase domain